MDEDRNYLDDLIQRSSPFLETRPHVGYPVDRVIRILESFIKAPQVKYVADVGCGFGHLSLALASHLPHSQIIGLDIDDNCLIYARRQAEINHVENRCQFRAVDIRGPVVSLCGTRMYDVATFLAVLGIFSDYAGLAKAAASFVRPGGVAIVDTAIIQTDELETRQSFSEAERHLRNASGQIVHSEELTYPYSRESSVQDLLFCLERSKDISANSNIPRPIVERRLNDMLADLRKSPYTSEVICKIWLVRF